MTDAQVFVLRIYRSAGRAGAQVDESVAGKVEIVRTGKEVAFRSMEELARVLSKQLRSAYSRHGR
jgi:hypothetical protein